MKKTLLISSLFVATALVSQSALAEVKVRAGVAGASYELGGNYIVATSSYTPVSVGLTFAGDNGMYLDLSASGGSGKHDGWKAGGYPAEKFKRSDASVIAGASFLNPENGLATTFYVGYKTGKTTLGAENVPYVAWYSETFKTSGFVFGGGASFPIAGGRAGSVGVNAGLGLMGATWQDDTGFNEKSKTAVGGSLGASYTYPFANHFGVIADLKYQTYNYKFEDNATWKKNITERIYTFGVSLYAKF
jgi:hypothetical protein